jgi:hypothetical protein
VVPEVRQDSHRIRREHSLVRPEEVAWVDLRVVALGSSEEHIVQNLVELGKSLSEDNKEIECAPRRDQP